MTPTMPLHAALSLALEALAAMPAGTNREDRAAATRTLIAARDAEVERGRVVTVERSCFTCSLCPADTVGDNCEPDKRGREDVRDYLTRSGTNDNVTGMPTDRSIACPGWAAKESAAVP